MTAWTARYPAGSEGQRSAGPGRCGPPVAGPGGAGPGVAGLGVVGPRITGPRITGPGGAGPRIAVKDAIDMAGEITGAGCAAVRDRARPAVRDAACLAGIRAAGVPIVGRTALTSLCLSPLGDNDAYGMPVNPAAPDRIPGGSSSGSAVVVAAGEADIALGTDTGGSVRIPAACCGIVGLKTTWSRVPLDGVWPLSPSLDTVGPLARDVAGVVTGMRLLDPSWSPDAGPARVVGRLRPAGVDAMVDAAVDAALAAAGLTVREVELPGWDDVGEPFDAILLAEFWDAHRALLDLPDLDADAADALRAGRDVTPADRAAAMAARAAWQAEVSALFGSVDALALPTLVGPPPPRDDPDFGATWLTAPFNLAGVPALSLPVAVPGLPVPAGLQLVGPMFGEAVLCATGRVVEAALDPA